MTTIIGIKIENRVKSAVCVQEILTKYGCIISTRIGLHENADTNNCDKTCSGSGLILLEIIDDEKACEMTKNLSEIDGIKIREMRF